MLDKESPYELKAKRTPVKLQLCPLLVHKQGKMASQSKTWCFILKQRNNDEDTWQR